MGWFSSGKDKPDRSDDNEYGRPLTRGERAYLKADKADRKAAKALTGRCSLWCGDRDCPDKRAGGGR